MNADRTEEYLEARVSFQTSAQSPLSDEITVRAALEQIRTGLYAPLVERLREIVHDTERYRDEKKALPGVTFCASFTTKRQQADVKVYNALIVLDIDKLDDAGLARVNGALASDEHVLSHWLSPSGKGYKGLVPIDFGEATIGALVPAHKHAFAEVSAYFKKRYDIELDSTGSDVSRLCFVSWDPNLSVRERVVPFSVSAPNVQVAERQTKRTANVAATAVHVGNAKLFRVGRNKSDDRQKIQSILKYLRKRGLSVTTSYHEWYIVGLAIADAFNYDIGMKYYLAFCRLDGVRHNEAESINKLRECYRTADGRVRMGMIVHYAKKKGYIGRVRRTRVMKVTEVQSQVSASTSVSTAEVARNIPEMGLIPG